VLKLVSFAGWTIVSYQHPTWLRLFMSRPFDWSCAGYLRRPRIGKRFGGTVPRLILPIAGRGETLRGG